VRRLLLVCAIAALVFAAYAAFANAQNSSPNSAPASNPLSAESDGLRASGVPGIQSSKPATVIVAGIAPRALTLDAQANVYLTNASAGSRIFTLTGLSSVDAAGAAALLRAVRLALVAGNGTRGSMGDGGNALNAQFDLELDSVASRSGLAVYPDGTIFIADTLNQTIRRVGGSDSQEPGIVRSIAGRWAPKRQATVLEPLGIALDRAGNLYVADPAAGTIDLLPFATTSSPGDQQVEIVAHAASPTNIALTADGGEVYVASMATGAVFAVNTQTREIQSVAAFPPEKDSSGQPGSACAGPKSAEGERPMVCPAGLAVDGGGNLFVADANSGNIVRVDPKTSAASIVASGLESPGEMKFDASGNLYVAEQGSGRIIKFAIMGQTTSNLTLSPPPPLATPPAPRMCPQTPPFNFCDQPTGGVTPSQAFTLTNNSGGTLTEITVSFTGANPADFQHTGNTCGTSLTAGASCVINVVFAPTAVGARAADLTVTDSAGDTASASLSGTGDDYQITLNGSPMEQSVIQGGKVTFNLNVAPDSTFGGPVTLLCPTNLPSLTVCTVSPQSVTITPGTPSSFSVTFETTYNGVTGGYPTNGVAPARPDGQDPNPPSAMWVLGLLLMTLASLAFARGRRSRVLPAARAGLFLAVFMLGVLIATLGGCKSAAVQPGSNTPAGSTNMIVQGSAQNAGRGASIVLDVVGRG
jgi:DNA-binding beta-propeller fold protein YncE